jgi:hypothetical protein
MPRAPLKKFAYKESRFSKNYSQERTDAAFSAQTPQEADAKIRDKCAEVWKRATNAQKDAAHGYTSGSGKYNRPLSGFKGSWGKRNFVGFKQSWEATTEYDKESIANLTDIIDESSYDFDMWLTRGTDEEQMESLLDIPAQKFKEMDELELQSIVGKSRVFPAFTSTGICKETGFTGKSVIMKIYAPAGTKMLYCEPFSNYNPYRRGGTEVRYWDGKSSQQEFSDEAEMVIQRGAHFVISKAEKIEERIYLDIDIHPERGYDMIERSNFNGKKREKTE